MTHTVAGPVAGSHVVGQGHPVREDRHRGPRQPEPGAALIDIVAERQGKRIGRVGAAYCETDPAEQQTAAVTNVRHVFEHAQHCALRIIGFAERVGDRVTIYVADEGAGIPRGMEEQIFEPFQRMGDRENRMGVGLGLSVAKGFVKAMGGTISATDTPGAGLTVAVDLAAPPWAQT
jgi:signal transduction histidine kinase